MNYRWKDYTMILTLVFIGTPRFSKSSRQIGQPTNAAQWMRSFPLLCIILSFLFKLLDWRFWSQSPKPIWFEFDSSPSSLSFDWVVAKIKPPASRSWVNTSPHLFWISMICIFSYNRYHNIFNIRLINAQLNYFFMQLCLSFNNINMLCFKHLLSLDDWVKLHALVYVHRDLLY